MRQSSAPPWMVFLIAIAVIFGAYYVWQGLRNYLQTGGLGIIEATERAEIVASATANQVVSQPGPTQPPTFTPIPECKTFTVNVPSAIVRESATTGAPIVTSWSRGTRVCVIDRAPADAEWYIVDGNPQTRRIEFAYMHETLIEALEPTPTPSRTPTALSTVTPQPTLTPSRTPTPVPTETIDPRATATPTRPPTLTPTLTPTPTTSFRSA